jgi:hypothetical protein
MVAENFNIVKDDFLLSLADGKDLAFNAAEYIIAWESLEKAPTDDTLRTLKYSAEMIVKDDAQREKIAGQDIAMVNTQAGVAEGPGMLLGRQEIYNEPTNHIWNKGLRGAKDIMHSHAVWPSFTPETGSPYTKMHFPFHSSIHPLLHTNSTSGYPAFVEKFRSHIFNGHSKEETQMEGLLHDELEKVKSPLIFGHNKKTLLGPIRVNGSNVSHQDDLYQRDYQRWKRNNIDAIKMNEANLSEGRSAEENENRLRVAHFEARAKQWVSDDYVVDENGDEHPSSLGHEGYMYGLEWLNPVERTAVMRRIHEEGGLDKSPLLKLPNGETIPSARIAWNNLIRRTPELNWATRGDEQRGANAHHRMESMEDYSQGDNRFLQNAFGEAAHTYQLLDDKKEATGSIADYIIEALHDAHGIEEDQNGEWVGKPFSFLPKLNLDKNDMAESYPLETKDGVKGLWASSRNHRPKKRNVMQGPHETFMSMEDILFLAGYDPKTRKPLLKHPIYGNMDGPIIPLEDIENMEEEAKLSGNIASRGKEMREHLTFLQAPHGPHPDEDAPNYWQLGGNGNFTVGPAKFWSQGFDVGGGAGMTHSTYNEIIHSLSPGMQPTLDEILPASIDADEPFNPFTGEGQKPVQTSSIKEDDTMPEFSSMFETKPHTNAITGSKQHEPLNVNPENMSLGLHFGTGKANAVGTWNPVTKKFDKGDKRTLLENIFSPANVFTKTSAGEKHNWTLHKTTLSPQTEYAIRNMNSAERKKFSTRYFHPSTTFNAMRTTHPEQAYSSHSGDGPILAKKRRLHYLKTMLGRSNSPHAPNKTSMEQLKALKDGNVPVTYGADHDDFIDFQGIGQRQPSFENTKRYIRNADDAKNMRILTALAKLNNNSATEVFNHLHGDIDDDENNIEFQQLKDALTQQDVALNTGDIEGLHNWLTNHRYELAQEKLEANKKESLSGRSSIKTLDKEGNALPFDAHTIHRALSMGGMYPSIQREEDIRTEIEQLQSTLYDPAAQGEFSPEGAKRIMNEIQELTVELNQLQSKAAKSVLGKTNPFEADAKVFNNLLKASRESVFQAAQFLLPRVLEHDPNHFSEELASTDPQQFLANHNRLMFEAERMLGTVPHDVHGIKTQAYRFGNTTEKVPQRQKGVHPKITEHLQGDEIFTVDGTMNTDEVLEGLGLTPKTTEQRNRMASHVQRIIDESNNTNQPLHVSTVGQLMESGKFDDDFFLHHLAGDKEFLQDSVNEGFHTAMENAQPKSHLDDNKKQIRSKWKQHPIHSITSNVVRTVADDSLMSPAGLSFFDAGGKQIDIHNRFGVGSGEKKYKTRASKNRLDSIVALNQNQINIDNMTPQEKTTLSVGFNQEPVPVGGINPDTYGIIPTHTGAGVVHSVANPQQSTFGIDFSSDGEPVVGTFTEPKLFQNTWQDAITGLHGKEVGSQVLQGLESIPVQNVTSPALAMNPLTYETAEDRIALGEMGEYIASLLNPDVLLTKSSDAEWVPPVRPMHRIFDLSDLEHLRGFSGSWVVSKWYDGKRVIIVQKDNEITTYDENGRKVGLKKAFKESLAELNDNNFVIDGIVGKEDLNIIDIINYDDTNVGEMLMHERMKVLRGQFDSHENVIIPGPHDTKMTDEEGLEDAVEILQNEHKVVLLRDNKSTYMKGERRHPKWLLLRKTRDFNFIILNRKGNGPFSYQLGAGPILDGESLGNRAVTHKNKFYMDVGTAHNQQKAFKVGDIVRATITGVSKKRRKSRDVYNVQVGQIESEGEGEGAASTESLDLLTKSFSPILIPHDLEYHNNTIQVILKNIDTVTYQVERIGENWYLHTPSSALGDLRKSNYSITLAESLHPYWHTVAPLMIEGHLMKLEMDEKDVPSRKIQDEQSAGVLDEKDDNRLLKPSTKKALEVISRALDQLAKEKLTWTGPRGLGIDMATPIESPSGPTKLTEESNLPDYDGKKRPDEEEIKPDSAEKKKKPIKHIEMKTDEDESIVYDDENDTPTLSV